MRGLRSRRALSAAVITVVVLACGVLAAVAVGGGIVKVQSTTISEKGLTMIVRRTVTDGRTTGARESVTEIVDRGTATGAVTRTLTSVSQRPPVASQLPAPRS